MRLRLSDGRTTHLGYCFNVLPGESVAALIAQARRIQGPVRARLGVARMGVGLWIARAAATELRDDAAARRALAAALAAEGLYVFTLNGFPYGGFHDPVVKARVFEPSWAEAARATYTEDLAELLVELMPEDVETGTISTVPLGAAGTDRAAARANLLRVAEYLSELPRRIELAVEPEPGAAIERADVLAAFLGPRDRIGVCLDCCHAAVVGEPPEAAFAAMTAANVRCPKIQISSALVAARPDLDETRARLAAFDEPRFLHQVRSDRGGAMDLPEALASLDRGAPWRVHFHVPVHARAFGELDTTRDAIAPVIAAAFAAPGALPHLEVETYTWGVLPARTASAAGQSSDGTAPPWGAERPTDDAGLVEGIARELEWTLEMLAEFGAKPA